MNAFLTYQRRMTGLILLLALLGSILLAVFLPDHLPWAAGFAMGGVVGLVVFRLRVMGILALEHLPQEQWRRHSIRTGMIGFVILIAGGVLSYWLSYLEAWTYLAGAVIERGVLMVDGMLRPNHLVPDALDEAASAGGSADAS